MFLTRWDSFKFSYEKKKTQKYQVRSMKMFDFFVAP